MDILASSERIFARMPQLAQIPFHLVVELRVIEATFVAFAAMLTVGVMERELGCRYARDMRGSVELFNERAP